MNQRREESSTPSRSRNSWAIWLFNGHNFPPWHHVAHSIAPLQDRPSLFLQEEVRDDPRNDCAECFDYYCEIESRYLGMCELHRSIPNLVRFARETFSKCNSLNEVALANSSIHPTRLQIARRLDRDIMPLTSRELIEARLDNLKVSKFFTTGAN